MSRHLSIVERHVGDADQYLASLAVRRDAARASSAQFWVFEHASEPKRFVEFIEGSNAELVAHLAGVAQRDLWHAVEVK
jgi:hypothetical protein